MSKRELTDNEFAALAVKELKEDGLSNKPFVYKANKYITTYVQRDKTIRRLGFKSYKTYLFSPLWKIIRGEILNRDGYQCRRKGCPKRATEVHHLNYSAFNLVGCRPNLLVSFCRDCHKDCEFDARGNKLTLLETMNKTFFLISGLRKLKGRTDDRIGQWYEGQLYDPQQYLITKVIITKLRKVKGLFERFEEVIHKSHWLENLEAVELEIVARAKNEIDLTAGAEKFKKKYKV